ncbi:MAG: hypothetical protein R3F49_14130 [Planctomycetota bacterium]
MITLLLCSALLQNTPSAPGLAGPGAPRLAGPAGPASAPQAASQDDFFIGRGQRGGPSGPVAQVVSRSYDARALALRDTDTETKATLRLVPALECMGGDPAWDASESELVAGSWVNLLVDLLGRSTQGEGRSVSVSSAGQVLVTGPPELQASTEGLLRIIADVANAETRLALSVISMPTSRAVAIDGALISRADASSLSEDASERYEVTLRGDAPARIDAVREVPVLLDYSVEVASGASVTDPTVVQCGLGTQLVALGAPGDGGVHLAFAIKRGALALGTRKVGVDLVSRHFGDDGRTFVTVTGRLTEDPEWTSTSFATSCFLPDDRALVLVGTGDGDTSEVLILHAIGATPAPFRVARFEGGGVAAFVNLGALAPPIISASGAYFSNEQREPRSMQAYEVASDLALLACGPVPAERRAVQDAVVRGLGRGYDQWSVGSWLVLRGDQRAETLADTLGERGTTLTVELRAERQGQVLRRARLPLRLGAAGAVSLTREALDAQDYDVEIAERTAMADPSLVHVFDGLVCWFRALPLDADHIVLELAGAAKVMGPRKQKSADDSLCGVMEERETERLGLRGRRVLTRDAGGVYRAEVGALSGAGLSFVIELR